jgi:hypothetical protein
MIAKCGAVNEVDRSANHRPEAGAECLQFLVVEFGF